MDKNGIGTDATHADHIKKIIDREYIYRSPDKFLAPSTLGIGLIEGYDAMGLELSLSKPHLRCEMERELKRICDGAKTKDDVVRESVNLYKAVYVKSVEEVAKLEESLGRCLQQAPDTGSAIWTPSSGNGAGGAEVCKCSTCSDGSLALRTKANGGWMVGCNLYPQCKCAIWIPDIVSSIAVSAETCPNCRSNSRGPAKLLDVRFKPGSAPPGTASPYKACIRGCDEFINEMFDLRPPPSNPHRPAQQQQQQQQPSYPPASIVVPNNGDTSGWSARNIPDSYWDMSTSSSTRQPPQQYQPPPQQQQPRSQYAGNTNGGGGAPSNAPLCSCQIPASRLITVKDGPNKGRPFFKCSKGAPGGCGYFEWQDQLSTPTGGPGGSTSWQQQSYQPPASASSSYTARGHNYRYSDEPEVKPKCRCGLFAAPREATKSGANQGREYYMCTRTFQGCGFVCWKDEVHDYMSRAQGGPPSMPGSASATSTCFKCGQAGHWARDCPSENGTGTSSFAAPPERHAAGGPAKRARGQGKTRASRGSGRGRGRGKRAARSSAVDESEGAEWDSDFA
ncbi:DNA topoisomerase 3-alpha [Coemansia sp. 'formosensis']|nr:DNA topoisomerase 3-alpha [Coemansia sp. 'formosensis']